jgi:hypothetical protein
VGALITLASEMSMRLQRFATMMLVLPISLTGCAGLGNLGGLGDILGGAMGGQGGGQVRAEIQSVDQNNQAIQVRTEDGQSGAVRYDQNTQVVYQQQQYPVTALERGDIVVMQIEQTQSGEPYVTRVDVEQSVQDRGGQSGTGQTGTGQIQVMEGQVGEVDYNQGAFQLRTQSSTVVVTLPYNPSSQTRDRFNRLRQGEYVTVEGAWLGQNRVELYRFR